MKRPKPPENNKAYEAMKTEQTLVDGVFRIEGVTMAKLLASTDEECRSYGLALAKFKTFIRGQ